jgi:hypothetical protein
MNYSSCTGRSNENLCSSSHRGAQEERKTGFLRVSSPPSIVTYSFADFLKSHSVYDQTQGTVLFFPDFEIDGFLSFIPAFNSNVHFCRF